MKGRPRKKFPKHVVGDGNIREYFKIADFFPPLPAEKLEAYIPSGMLLLTEKASYRPDGKKWSKIDL